MEIDNSKMEIDHSRWPEFSYFNTLNFPQPFTKAKFRTVDAVSFIASLCCTTHSSEKKARLIQYDRMLRMAMLYFMQCHCVVQGLLTVFHFKVFSQRAKKSVVCQVLWMLLLHQGLISVITEHKRDCYGYNVSRSESSAGAGRKKGDRHAHQSQKQTFICPFSPYFFPPSFLLLIFKQAACILSQWEFRLWPFNFPFCLSTGARENK